MKREISITERILVALCLGASPFSMAIAQTPGSDPTVRLAEASDNADQIEDIIVTAQKRTEKAQDVPISLQSFSSDALHQTGVDSTEDLTAVIGGILIQPTATRTSIYIRGVGGNSSSTTDAVLTFIDGVYQPFGQSTDLGNIASVEVLKGPQGTLFGRNATGGVIQITTKPPSETPSARAEIGYGNYNTVDGSAYLTGGLATGVAMDLSMRYSNQKDGFGQNIFNGDDVFLSRRSNVRSRIRFDISDMTNLTLAGDYGTTRGTVGTTIAPAFGYGYLFVNGARRERGSAFYPGDYDINSGPRTPLYKSKEWGVSGTFQTEFEALTFRSITAYRRSSERGVIDYDAGPADIVNIDIVRSPRTMFTQELQLISSNDSPLQWVAGLFYYNSVVDVSPFRINDIVALNTAKDRSIAPYAQATYEFLPETRLTLGGRYTVEKRSIEGFSSLPGFELPGTRGKLSQKFKEPTWRIALDHKLSPTVLVYGSVSRGFNAGFFNDSTFSFGSEVDNPPVHPEFLTAYEIGTKTDLLNRRLRLNLSAFLYDYKGLQQQIYDNGSVRVINAGAARIKGLDFEVVARPVNALTLSVSGTYLDTHYRSYELAPNYIGQPNGSIIADGNLDAAGKTITNSPKISYTATVSHVLETSIGDFTTTANLNYRGKAFVDPNNRFKLPKRYLLNLSEQWTSSDSHLFATLWVKNVLNKRYDYAINLVDGIGLAGNPAPPRTYGASIGFQF